MADRQRAAILEHLRDMRREVEQIFTDAASWNENARAPGEPAVDPDPCGDMRRLLASIDDILTNDPGHGPIALLKWQRAH